MRIQPRRGLHWSVHVDVHELSHDQMSAGRLLNMQTSQIFAFILKRWTCVKVWILRQKNVKMIETEKSL